MADTPWHDLPEPIRDLLADLEPDWHELEAYREMAASLDWPVSDLIWDLYWGKHGVCMSQEQMRALKLALGEMSEE